MDHSTNDEPLPLLITEGDIESLFKERWGASEVKILGFGTYSMVIYHRGGHATVLDSRRKDVDQSLVSLLATSPFYRASFQDGGTPYSLIWHDGRAPRQWPFQTQPHDYRTGEICRVGDAIYRHSGSSQYFVLVDEGNQRREIHMRDMPGFHEEVSKSHDGMFGTFAAYSLCERARQEPAFKNAAEFLSRFHEDQYWYDVACFLIRSHERFDAQSRMIHVLNANGFDDALIEDAGLRQASIPTS